VVESGSLLRNVTGATSGQVEIPYPRPSLNAPRGGGGAGSPAGAKSRRAGVPCPQLHQGAGRSWATPAGQLRAWVGVKRRAAPSLNTDQDEGWWPQSPSMAASWRAWAIQPALLHSLALGSGGLHQEAIPPWFLGGSARRFSVWDPAIALRQVTHYRLQAGVRQSMRPQSRAGGARGLQH